MKQKDVRCTATAREEFVNVLASKLTSVNGKYLTNLAKVMGYSNSKFTDMKKRRRLCTTKRFAACIRVLWHYAGRRIL